MSFQRALKSSSQKKVFHDEEQLETTFKRKKRFIDSEASRKFIAAADPDEEPSTSQNWVWRVLKAALPLQLALIALFCAACFLEPHCCEASNNVNFIFTPQLRYIRGPPPI
ncbi:Protein of unknown function [Cotesia congregata]|uniref:KASH domain-containing protein n=1 Tax=Cotesia congregata TaxID=51543 RepID=A0A8J2HNC4_COTCN|nr:Protein of unknown function [Cotesia congregata]